MLEVVDIAGLVRGASRGEGLGNRFLAGMQETDAILHVVRCHDNQAAPHFLGEPDPVRDAGIISAELMLADIATLERYMERLTPARVGDAPAREKYTAADNLRQRLDRGEQVRLTGLSAPETAVTVGELRLLTAKAVVFVANVPDPTWPPPPAAIGVPSCAGWPPRTKPVSARSTRAPSPSSPSLLRRSACCWPVTWESAPTRSVMS